MPENKQPKPLLPDSKEPVRRRRPFYKHPLFFFVLIIVLIIGAFFAIKHFTTKADSLTESTSKSQESSSDNSTIAKTSTVATDASPDKVEEIKENTSVSPDGKTPEKYEGSDPNSNESLTGTLSTARFDNDKLILRVTIDQYLSGGTCSLTLSSGDNFIEKTANLTPVVSTSSCEGFDIANTELSDFSRPINITINLTSGDKTGIITGVVE